MLEFIEIKCSNCKGKQKKAQDVILEQLRQANKHLHKINKKIKLSKHQQSRTNTIK